jgi:hypothetical protein
VTIHRICVCIRSVFGSGNMANINVNFAATSVDTNIVNSPLMSYTLKGVFVSGCLRPRMKAICSILFSVHPRTLAVRHMTLQRVTKYCTLSGGIPKMCTKLAYPDFPSNTTIHFAVNTATGFGPLQNRHHWAETCRCIAAK